MHHYVGPTQHIRHTQHKRNSVIFVMMYIVIDYYIILLIIIVGGVKMVAPMMAKTLRQMKGMRR